MEIADGVRLAFGLLFALVGAAVLYFARGSRGFNQRRQAGALLIVGAIVFFATGLGLVDF